MNPVFCAMDTNDLQSALDLVEKLRGEVSGIKLGLEFFLAHGVAGYRAMAQKGLPIFLDLKLHDIPNTVAGAVKSLLPLEPAFITLHASGGAAMMRAAADAAQNSSIKLLAVTVLTSLDARDLSQVGQGADTGAHVLRLARLAHDNGMHGAVCSPEEISALRSALGKDFILMVPGIRPLGVDANDQKRALAPRQAMAAGATHLVIGRPITKAADPIEAARRIAAELA